MLAKGVCGELSSKAGRFPLTCANRFLHLTVRCMLTMKMFTLLFLTWSNLQQLAVRSIPRTMEAFLVHQNSFRGALQTVLPDQTCSAGVVLDSTAAFEQVGTCSTPEVFGVPQRRSGVTRSAHPSCRANL
eukprot:2425925-Amphidinium_carterae.1